MAHNPNSYIHRASDKVLEHLEDEQGLCQHPSVAIAAMFGLTEATVYVVRTHLETCPANVKHYRLPYRANQPLVLADPTGLTKLETAKKRSAPAMAAAQSIARTITRMTARNVEGLRALSKDAYVRGAADFGDVYEAMAMDYETRGSLHPMTIKAMEALGIKVL